MEAEWAEREASEAEARHNPTSELGGEGHRHRGGGGRAARARRAGGEGAAAAPRERRLPEGGVGRQRGGAPCRGGAAGDQERNATVLGGDVADGVRLRLQAKEAEMATASVAAELERVQEAHARELTEMRTQLRQTELLRLGQLGAAGLPRAAGAAAGACRRVWTRSWSKCAWRRRACSMRRWWRRRWRRAPPTRTAKLTQAEARAEAAEARSRRSGSRGRRRAWPTRDG